MGAFRVREADEYDASVISALGSSAPELDVGGVAGRFPSLDELETDLFESDWLVVVDERNHVWGFCCARINDGDGRSPGSACLVYLFVESRHRRQGLAKMLWEAMSMCIQAAGVEHVYTWANPTSGVVEFFERHGFAKGKPCVWMDVRL